MTTIRPTTMTEVALNRCERRLANFIARSWTAVHALGETTNLRRSPEDDFAIILRGVEAEIAFCKGVGIYYEPRVARRDMPRNDVVMPNGMTADVKCTNYPNGRLICLPSKRNKPCALYVLMVGDAGVYRIAGFATKAEMFSDRHLTDLGHGPTYAIEQRNLRPWTWKAAA